MLCVDAGTPDKASREMLLEGLLRSSEKHEGPFRSSLLSLGSDPRDLASVSEERDEQADAEDADADAAAGQELSARRRSLSNPVAISIQESPLSGGGEDDLDLDDRVEDAGEYGEDICLRGGGDEETGEGEGEGQTGTSGDDIGSSAGGISHEVC